MKHRQFYYANSNTGPLAQNGRHAFALTQSMSIFKSATCCTWIPKNACSTLRFSVAKANGCVFDLSDVNWIHTNNSTFNATTQTAFMADYTFVVLRCPFSRLYSAFMDKFVALDIQSWKLRSACDQRFHPHDLTFRMLLRELKDLPMPRMDIHLRCQTDFLLFRKYDDYFALEAFGDAVAVIEDKAGIHIHDTRAALGHDTSQRTRTRDFEAPMDIAALDLLARKRQGHIPEPAIFFDDECVDIVKKVWASDLGLYKRKFGNSELMKQFA